MLSGAYVVNIHVDPYQQEAWSVPVLAPAISMDTAGGITRRSSSRSLLDEENLLGPSDSVGFCLVHTQSKLYECFTQLFLSRSREFQVLTQGEDKLVCLRKREIKNGSARPHGDYLYYTGRFYYLGCVSKETDLRYEANQMSQIAVNCNTRYLAVCFSEMHGFDRIDGQYTIQVPAAIEDCAAAMRRNGLSLQFRLLLAWQFAQGLTDLHEGGFAHGDLKPENALIFWERRTTILKLADFGRAVLLGPDEAVPYVGNWRFAPPEALTSQKGDVYSMALVVVRIFEEALLMHRRTNVLVEVPEAYKDGAAFERRRGLDRYIVEHSAFPVMDEVSAWDTLRKRVVLPLRWFNQTEEDRKHQAKLLRDYVDRVMGEMTKVFAWSKAQDLGGLLKTMLVSNPAQRPDMKVVSRRIAELHTRP